MEFSMQTYFDQLDRVRYEGPKSTPLAFRHYNPDELVLGKRMEDHLRWAAWHTFCYGADDMAILFAHGNGNGERKAERFFSINSTCLTTASTTLTSRRKAFAQGVQQ
jgi:xylose isomerase